MHKAGRKVVIVFFPLLCLLWLSPSLESHETLTTTVLFDREIVHILDKHCVMCHTESGPAVPLETYEQTWLLGRKMRSEVIARHMPPWAAVSGYGQFINDNGLTLRETQFVVSWVEGLGPRNAGTVFTNVAASSAPKAPVRAKADFGHWQLGPPNLSRPLEPGTIEPGQPDSMKRVVIDAGLKEERRLRALEYLPGDRRVIRAAFFSIQETGQWIGSWTPWYEFAEAAPNTSYRLPAGAHIVAEIYYRSAKERVSDRGTLGLYFADKPAPATISDLVLDAKPAGREGRFHSEVTLPAEIRATAIRVEPAPGLKTIEVSERRTNGGTQVLLFAKDISPEWPTPYIFKSPVRLGRGSILSVTSYAAPVKVTVSKF